MNIVRAFVAALFLSLAAQGQLSVSAEVHPFVPVYAPVAGYDWIPYCPSDVPDHPVLRIALFREAGPLPPGGRAPIVVPILSYWTRTEQPPVITRAEHPDWWRYVHAGFDLWLVSLPPCRGGSSPVAVDDPIFDVGAFTDPQHLGPAYLGNGTTYLPGGAQPALLVYPVEDPAWLMPLKTFAMACQWLADGNGEAAGSRMDMATMKGRSAGFDTGAYVALGPDLAPFIWPGATSGTKAVSTRIFKAVIGEIGPTWFPIFKGTSVGTDFKATKYAIAAPPWDVPATDFDQCVDIIGNSPLFFAQLPKVYGDNVRMHVYLQYAQSGTGTMPYTIGNFSKTEKVAHSNWHGKAMRVALLVDRLVATTLMAYDPAYFDDFLNVNLDGEDILYKDEVQWLKASLGYFP